jgi:anti-sigma B factor antagonist
MAERRFSIWGEIDIATAPKLEHDLGLLIDEGEADLNVDCRDLTFIDSSGVRVLLDAQRLLQADGRNLRITNIEDPPRRVLEVLGLMELLRVGA